MQDKKMYRNIYDADDLWVGCFMGFSYQIEIAQFYMVKLQYDCTDGYWYLHKLIIVDAKNGSNMIRGCGEAS